MHAALRVAGDAADVFPRYGADLFDTLAALVEDSPTFRGLALDRVAPPAPAGLTASDTDWAACAARLRSEADADRRAAARFPDPFAGLPRR